MTTKLSTEPSGYGLGIGLALQITGFELGTLILEMGAIGFRGTECLALRQQKIARVAVLDFDHIADLSKAPNALEQYDFHCAILLIVGT